ncbi:MAG: glutamate--tRNA ligase [Chloroflexi bacterium]|nr:glutamate--tRNA ligase [Chloroflexota bacterium]
MTVRVRYAPSPTGEPHVGNIRAALFNWLYARHRGGRFIVRIEDTDQARLVPGATEAILNGLRWLGLDWDEGPDVGGPYAPYIQSQRLSRYQEAADRLLAEGHAYRCYCSPERLEQVRAEQARRKEPPRYDRHCRDLTDAQRADYAERGVAPVVRLRTPLEGQTAFHDYLRGNIVVDNSTLDDFVLLKSDGFPTYHLANVVDDHLMDISHVMRGDEWLPSTPRHVLLYEALGFAPPVFVHLPLILGTDRTKLSKRHGATSITEYRERGYLAEAMMNFLALLGWAYDEKTELFTRAELIRYFPLERLGKTPAVFNPEKLDWMNGVYIRRLAADDLAARLVPFLERDLPPQVPRPLDATYVAAIVPLIHDRLKRLGEVAELTDFFFLEELAYETRLLLGKDLTADLAGRALETTLPALEGLEPWDAPTLERVIRGLAEDLGMKTGPYFGVLRVAVTGKTAAPPLFQTMAVLGRARTLKRLHDARAALLNVAV